MTDNELLLEFSKMLDPIRENINDIKEDINGIKEDIVDMKADIDDIKEDIDGMKEDIVNMKEDIDGIKEDIVNMKEDIVNMKEDIDGIKHKVKKIELTQENKMLPRLNTIESCYTSTFDRYKDSVEDYKTIKQDISIMKKVITEHSEKLQHIS